MFKVIQEMHTRCLDSRFSSFLFSSAFHLFVKGLYSLSNKNSPFSGNLLPDALCARSLSCQPLARRRLSALWLWIVTSMCTATAVRCVMCPPCPASSWQAWKGSPELCVLKRSSCLIRKDLDTCSKELGFLL